MDTAASEVPLLVPRTLVHGFEMSLLCFSVLLAMTGMETRNYLVLARIVCVYVSDLCIYVCVHVCTHVHVYVHLCTSRHWTPTSGTVLGNRQPAFRDRVSHCLGLAVRAQRSTCLPLQC